MKISVPFILFLIVASCKTAPKNPWTLVQNPAHSPENISQSIGGYSAGCILGAESLPADGKGYQLMRLSRRRFFGHPALIQFIKSLSKQVATQKLGVLLIGDLGQPRGGPTNSNHRSHQNGLDVDIWFLQTAEAEQRSLTPNEREQLSAHSVLGAGDGVLDPQFWSESQIKTLKLATEYEEVERIFVHPSIKKNLCDTLKPKQRAWLRKLRPWWNHHDHFHVRLRCPKNQPECREQEPVPSGSGCDESLNAWFTPEAKAKDNQEELNTIPPMPVLPKSCDQVLQM